MRICHWLSIVLLAGAGNTAVATTRSYFSRAVDLSNLRQIGQAALIYASDNHERLPEANDVWDYARLLSERGGLNDGNVWQSRIDPGYVEYERVEILLGAGPTKAGHINPEFLKLKPAYAVALGKIRLSSPSSTPIAWTRGLQTDGTWAKHSPYGEKGGYILFISGQITFYDDLKPDGGQLRRYQDGSPTANILDALPPGTRIGEYIPNNEEMSAWMDAPRTFSHPAPKPSRNRAVLYAVIFLPFVIIAALRVIQGRRLTVGLLLWPAFLCAVFTMLIPII